MSEPTTLAKRQQTFKSVVERAQPAIAAILPRHMDAERIARIALLAMNKTPMLYECDPMTVLQSVMQASALGLEINTPLGHAYLIPFRNRQKQVVECQLIPGYRGYVDLARRTGKVSTLYADVIFEGEEYAFERGLNARLTHKPDLDRDENDPAKVIAAYAVAVVDGHPQFEIMGRKALDRIRAGSRSANNGPWVTHTVEQFKKTVIRRLCKVLPMSPEVAALTELDNRFDTGKAGAVSPLLDFDPATGGLPAVEEGESGQERVQRQVVEQAERRTGKMTEEALAAKIAEKRATTTVVSTMTDEDRQEEERLRRLEEGGVA